MGLHLFLDLYIAKMNPFSWNYTQINLYKMIVMIKNKNAIMYYPSHILSYMKTIIALFSLLKSSHLAAMGSLSPALSLCYSFMTSSLISLYIPECLKTAMLLNKLSGTPGASDSYSQGGIQWEPHLCCRENFITLSWDCKLISS